MGKIIGIDLGTTNSCVCVMEGGKPTVIQNEEGARTTPSVIAFTKDGEQQVGQMAKNQAISNPENTVYSIKRFMGRLYNEVSNEINEVSYKIKKGKGNHASVYIGNEDKTFTPQEISAKVLQKMKKTAEEHLGTKVDEAIVTVPAYFNDAQRQATKDAGQIAGLNVKRIINEPTAAALAYGLNKNKDEIVAVYDLGGGTFDISILDIADGVIEVLATNGDSHLGGDDFDQEVINWLVDNFKKDQGIDLSKDAMVLQRLKEAAEKAKVELSGTQKTTINLPFVTADANGPKHLNYDLTRSKFNQLTNHLVERSMEPVRKALKDAKIEKKEIAEIILVGGSTRIPAVQDTVEGFFEKKANKSVNPDEVVALGASIQGGILAGDENVDDILLLDVTPLSLGIETLGGVMTNLIDRNTTIPSKKSQVFSTAADNQNAVSINVLQGERSMAADNRTLGKFDLVGIPPAPRGTPQIEVTFNIDANGILHVSAKDKKTNKEQSIKIERAGSLSDEEINKMKKDAEAHEEEDKNRKEMITAKNELDSLIFQTEKSLKENKDKLEADEVKKIEDAIAEAKEKLEKSNTKEEIEEVKKDFAEKAQKLGEILYKEQAAKQGQAGPGAEGFGGAQGPNPNAGAQPKEEKKSNDDPIDAEFEEVD